MEDPEFEIYYELLREVITKPLTEEEALMWMVLLHAHEIYLWREPPVNSDTVEDESHERRLAALTQRGAADVIAELWPDREDKMHCKYTHWYYEYNHKIGFEYVSSMPEDVQRKVEQLRQLLETHPLVLSVIEEE